MRWLRACLCLLWLGACMQVFAQAPTASQVEANTATVAELDSVRGIGPAMSRNILQERAKAQFSDWQDLTRRVPGLGQAKARRLSDQGLRVNGKPFTEEPVSTPKK